MCDVTATTVKCVWGRKVLECGAGPPTPLPELPLAVTHAERPSAAHAIYTTAVTNVRISCK